MVESVICNKVEHYFQLAEQHYDRHIPRPLLKMSNKMTSTAGSAHATYLRLGFDTIKFSQPIYDNNDKESFLNTTIPHEVAHIVEFHVFGVMTHGPRFEFIMRTIFGDTRRGSLRCHNFTTKKRQKTRYVYTCDGCGETIYFTRGEHKKEVDAVVFRGSHAFKHRCDRITNQPMTFTGKIIKK